MPQMLLLQNTPKRTTDASPPPLLPAWRLVPPPSRARAVARWLAVAFVVFLALCLLAPWQQSVKGDGAVVAWDPAERPITVDAPLSGRVKAWHVREGQRVEAGQLLVSLEDNDPGRLGRLTDTQRAAQDSLDRKLDSARSVDASYQAAQLAADAKRSAAASKVESASAELAMADQAVAAKAASYETARRNLERIQTLHAEGLESQRSLELARRDADTAAADLEAARSKRDKAAADLEAARRTREEVVADTDSKLRDLESKLAKARSDAADAEAKFLDKQSSLARQQQQEVRAPRDGVIQRLLVAVGTEQVKSGDALATLVPPRRTERVALTIDGNDASLVAPGRKVRLQFEGWPAVQFVGWPSVATGTFGGVVDLVDPASSGSGDFRVLVRPDPDDVPWPDPARLRPGVQTQGWVLLDTVSLGYELWRQFNGFPPVVEAPPGASKVEKGK